MNRRLLLFFFFLSGSCGLIYEIVWTRLFEFAVGSSHHSIAIVVSTFMGGLAIGSLAGGRLADRSASRLALYGWLVLGTGLYCAIIPFLIGAANSLFGAVYRLHDGEPAHPLFIGVKLVTSVAILLVPTTLMGATLPALTRHITSGVGEVGARLGSLYAANTLGAVAGAWGAGFLLIPTIGLLGSSILAAAVDASVGLTALWIARRSRSLPVPVPAPAPVPVPAPPARPRKGTPAPAPAPTIAPDRTRLVIWAFALSGMVDMCLQLAWTRSLILTLGNSTYAFSIIVGIFILGLSAGSALATPFADRLRHPQAALGWVMVGAALAAGASIPALGVFAPTFSQWLVAIKVDATFPRYLALGGLWAAVLIFPSTVFMGMTFPLVGRLAVRELEKVGGAIGRAYFANTLGSIVGTLMVGFAILPWTGRLWAPLYLAVAVGAAVGLVLIFLETGTRSRLAGRILATGAILAVILPCAWITRPWGVGDLPSSRQRFWDPVTLSMCPYLNYDLAYKAVDVHDLEEKLRLGQEVVYHRDGEMASVDVLAVKGTNRMILRINGKPEASSGGESLDMPTQLFLGHLPMLARSGAKQVLNIGLGSGITTGAMALYPDLERLTCVEICPEAVDGARYFKEANHGALDNPRVKVIVGDGRNHLQHTSDRYDVISSQPSNFWIAGLGNLFTREFYQLVKEHLTEGGVACQWIQGYHIRSSEFRIAVRTLAEKFPHLSLWTTSGDFLFLASTQPIEWRRDWIERCLGVAQIAADLKGLGVDRPEALFRDLRLEDDAVKALAGEGPLNTDLFPRLEYLAPLGLFADHFEVPPIVAAAPFSPLQARLAGFEGKEAIEAYRRRGTMLHRLIDLLDSPPTDEVIHRQVKLLLEIAAEKDPWLLNTAALQLKSYSVGIDAAPSGQGAFTPEAHRWALFFKRALLFAKEPELHRAYQRLRGERFSRDELQAQALGALPGDWTLAVLLAEEALGRGDAAEGSRSAQAAAERGAPPHLLGIIQGVAQSMRGDLPGAEASFAAALRDAPPAEQSEVLFNWGLAKERGKDFAAAAEMLERALAQGLDPIRGGLALSRCLLESGKATEALAAAEKVLTLRKDLPEALAIAGRAARALGDEGKAKGYLERAAKLDPARFGKEIEKPGR